MRWPNTREKKNWEKLDKNNFEYLNPKSWMKPWRLEVIQFLKSLLESEKQPRDDYRECIELVLVVLGDPPKNFSFKKPGPFHKARWMAPWLYGTKIFLFRKREAYHHKVTGLSFQTHIVAIARNKK